MKSKKSKLVKIRMRRQIHNLRRQLANLDVSKCVLYWCVACKKFKPKYLMKYYYVYPAPKTLRYGKNRKAKATLCYHCMRVINYKNPWVRVHWIKRPWLKLIHKKYSRYQDRYSPWEKGYETMHNTSEGEVSTTTRKKQNGLLRETDGIESNRDSSSVKAV